MRYDALGEDVEGNMGVKNRAYVEGRLKLLESGGNVIKPFSSSAANGGSGGGAKWKAKAESKGYNAGDDYSKNGGGGKKRSKLD